MIRSFLRYCQTKAAPKPEAVSAEDRRIARKVERERARLAHAAAEAKRLRECRLRFTGGGDS
jgi:hypothetical protein